MFNLIRSKKSLLIKLAIQEKEIEILKRQKKKKLNLKISDRVIFSILSIVGNIRNNISIVNPETVLKWQRNLIKNFWTLRSNNKNIGRPQVNQEIKQLILRIKNENQYVTGQKVCGAKIAQWLIPVFPTRSESFSY